MEYFSFIILQIWELIYLIFGQVHHGSLLCWMCIKKKIIKSKLAIKNVFNVSTIQIESFIFMINRQVNSSNMIKNVSRYYPKEIKITSFFFTLLSRKLCWHPFMQGVIARENNIHSPYSFSWSTIKLIYISCFSLRTGMIRGVSIIFINFCNILLIIIKNLLKK